MITIKVFTSEAFGLALMAEEVGDIERLRELLALLMNVPKVDRDRVEGFSILWSRISINEEETAMSGILWQISFDLQEVAMRRS